MSEDTPKTTGAQGQNPPLTPTESTSPENMRIAKWAKAFAVVCIVVGVLVGIVVTVYCFDNAVGGVPLKGRRFVDGCLVL